MEPRDRKGRQRCGNPCPDHQERRVGDPGTRTSFLCAAASLTQSFPVAPRIRNDGLVRSRFRSLPSSIPRVFALAVLRPAGCAPQSTREGCVPSFLAAETIRRSNRGEQRTSWPGEPGGVLPRRGVRVSEQRPRPPVGPEIANGYATRSLKMRSHWAGRLPAPAAVWSPRRTRGVGRHQAHAHGLRYRCHGEGHGARCRSVRLDRS